MTDRGFPGVRRLGVGARAGFLVTVGLVVLYFVLQLGVGIGAVTPDLLTVALMLNVLRVRAGTAAVIGFGLGLLEDAFTLLVFGANTVAMTVVGILGVLARNQAVSDSKLFYFGFIAAGKWVRDLIYWILQLLSGDYAGGFWEQMILAGVPAALYTGFAGLLVVVIVGPFEDPVS